MLERLLTRLVPGIYADKDRPRKCAMCREVRPVMVVEYIRKPIGRQWLCSEKCYDAWIVSEQDWFNHH